MNKNQRKNKRFTWKKYHRWFGLVLSVFMLVFCVSGIILNHRQLFAGCSVSRSLLPSDYHIEKFNNGIIKGSIKLSSHSKNTQNMQSATSEDSILAFGYAGVWLTDGKMKEWKDFNAGLPTHMDDRNIRNIVQTKDGKIWCAAMRDIYLYNGRLWEKLPLPGNEERVADITLSKDSANVVALTRSAVYMIVQKKKSADKQKEPTSSQEKTADKQPYTIHKKIIGQPEGFIPETTLFKTVWTLHSGEYFGLAGRLVVDAIAIVLIILSITGIILFILPYGIRRQKRIMAIEEKRTLAKQRMIALGKRMVWNAKWHNKIGYVTIILTLWISITGMCLRPPLMIPLVMNKTTQKIKDGNVWNDKLRGIRWNAASQSWLVSTSEGFLQVDELFCQKPKLYDKGKSPKISPMGITVFENDGKGGWLIGSFSGMSRWYPEKNLVLDYFTNKPNIQKSMIPVTSSLVCGYSKDFFGGKDIVFDYGKGANIPVSTPKLLSDTPMSLWNVALELHVGRCYSPFLGPLSSLFVFLSGLLITLVLLSGYIILHRRKQKKAKRASTTKE